jgi:hypothetical protein
MGYRSIVRSCIYSDDAELFEAFISGRKLIDDTVFSEGDDGFIDNLEYPEKIYKNMEGELIQTIKILALHGDDWKWYEEYEYVKAWHKLLTDAEVAGLNYEFVRVGEEDGDIDYQCGGENVEHFLSTYTNINVDY